MSKNIQYIIITVLLVLVIVLAVVIAFGSSKKNPDAAYGSPAADPSISDKTPDTSSADTGGDDKTPDPTAGTEPPLRGMTVCIDPGHQGKGNSEKEPAAPWGADKNADINNTTMKSKCASGTTGKYSGVDEYIVTLDISMKMKAVLEELGANVVMTRESHDVDLSNKDRAEIGNNASADVVLRIHCNGAENESANGIELYVRDKGDGSSEYKTRSEYDFSLGSELIKYLIDATGAKNRGVKKSDVYTGINWSEVPCIIIECGFMSNETEDKALVNEEYQQKLAVAVGEWLKNSKLIGK